MDRTLADRLNELWRQNDRLKEAEGLFLRLEAERKPMQAQLTLKMDGKSFSEREARALASTDWRHFMVAHVQAESDFNFERRKYSILEQAFYAEYSAMKNDERALKKPMK